MSVIMLFLLLSGDIFYTTGESAESAMLINSLRDVIKNQASQIEELQTKLKDAVSPGQQVNELETKLKDAESSKQAEVMNYYCV